MAVNCFATDPDSKMVSGVFGTSCSRSAMPYALVSTGLPPTATPTAQPGVDDVHLAKTRSDIGFEAGRRVWRPLAMRTAMQR